MVKEKPHYNMELRDCKMVSTTRAFLHKDDKVKSRVSCVTHLLHLCYIREVYISIFFSDRKVFYYIAPPFRGSQYVGLTGGGIGEECFFPSFFLPWTL